VTTNQVLIGVGLILVLAVGSQVLASRLKIPALIILLPAGFTAGAITTDVNPQLLLGAAFQPLVSRAVAVILTTPACRWTCTSSAVTPGGWWTG
jgi:NhaP-type Na+/H+ or K+/H+ antiporter